MDFFFILFAVLIIIIVFLYRYFVNQFFWQLNTNKRHEIGYLDDWTCIYNKVLGGKISFENCIELKFIWIIGELLVTPINFGLNQDFISEIDISDCSINCLDISTCHNLKKLQFRQSYRCELQIVLFQNNKIEFFILRNVKLQDLEFVAILKPSSLETFHLSIEGSLVHIKDMRKLKVLSITSTKINEGYEYLPQSLETLYCNDTKIYKELKKLNPQNNLEDHQLHKILH
ncbi:8115_t:CDS:2 [Dentiscutata erythropus]|uniref:8115_t:CDS:1 n=1 Tax=Dentiscutata erythropus TaxID=1348616 RepID=A0A9N9FVI1_9GLOM|nr:8115_t:CDS:2 [Dentiscutata erythropus]